MKRFLIPVCIAAMMIFTACGSEDEYVDNAASAEAELDADNAEQDTMDDESDEDGYYEDDDSEDYDYDDLSGYDDIDASEDDGYDDIDESVYDDDYEENAPAEESNDDAAETATNAATSSAAGNEGGSKDASQGMAELMDSLKEVGPGTAGCSLRAEETADILMKYVRQYSDGTVDANSFEVLCSDWIASNEGALDYSALDEAMDDVFKLLEDKGDYQEGDVGILAVVNGIKNAIESNIK